MFCIIVCITDNRLYTVYSNCVPSSKCKSVNIVDVLPNIKSKHCLPSHTCNKGSWKTICCFDTFTFDKITKGIKANWIDKIAHFGGTAGLFNGFAIIAAFEFIAFGFALLIQCYNGWKHNKKKISNVVEVKELQSNKNT